MRRCASDSVTTVGRGGRWGTRRTMGRQRRTPFEKGPSLTSWNELYARFGEIDRARQAREQWRLSELEARRAFDAWSERTTGAVMKAFLAFAADRSVEFERNTGARILLKYPAHRTIGTGEDGAAMRFLEMHLREARVHFYSFAEQGRLPLFYFMPTQATRRGAYGGRRFRTLISVAACQAIRTPDDGYELCLQAGMTPGTTPNVKLDDLVLRAFGLLLEELERVAFSDALLRAPRPCVAPDMHSLQT